MTRNTWIIFTAVVVLLLGGLVFLSNKDKVDVGSINGSKVQTGNEASGGIDDHVFGNKDSKVTLVEYGDFQCPGCKSAAEPISQVKKKYEEQLGFIFRNFPLTNIHPNAKVAAASAEVAGLEGKYWEMHDLLYASQDEWSAASGADRTDLFAGYAQQIGIDKNTFTTALEEKNEAITKKISYDQALGRKVGVSGTPSFFLNGKEIDDVFKDGKLVPQGTEGAANVWTDADAFETLILLPAFKEAGIDVSKVE